MRVPAQGSGKAEETVGRGSSRRKLAGGIYGRNLGRRLTTETPRPQLSRRMTATRRLCRPVTPFAKPETHPA